MFFKVDLEISDTVAMIKMKYWHSKVCMYIAIITMTSCESFLEVDPPNSKIPVAKVFVNDDAATSVVKGMYIELYRLDAFAAGGDASVMMQAGLSSDELFNAAQDIPVFMEFERNQINPENGNLFAMWKTMYESIYKANTILEGIESSNGISSSVSDQLRGEALFVRAFCHFYLVNLFGEVPIVVTTDYKINARLHRNSEADVYARIKEDLTMAENLLVESYVDNERWRANRFAASALLARVYLYTEDWARAEEKASKVIDKVAMYDLVPLSNVFLANNKEAVWQIRGTMDRPITNEANIFNPSLADNFLRPEVLSAFETNDQRRTAWVTSVVTAGSTLYVPRKYMRRRVTDATPVEYSVVIRVAEVHLIRAEARIRLDKLALAIADIDEIRFRAGLPLIQTTNPGVDDDTLLEILERERRIELLTEWGHRWLDLKRRDLANAVLGPMKSGWTSDDQLYPIPAKELLNNSNLAPQNPGY